MNAHLCAICAAPVTLSLDCYSTSQNVFLTSQLIRIEPVPLKETREIVQKLRQNPLMSQTQVAEFNDSARDIFFQYSIFKCNTCLKFVHKEKFVAHSQACSQPDKSPTLANEDLTVKGNTLAESLSISQMTGFRTGCLISDTLTDSTREVNTNGVQDHSEVPITPVETTEAHHSPSLPGELIDIKDALENTKQHLLQSSKDNSQKGNKRFSLVIPVKKPVSSSRDKNLSILQKKNDQTTKNAPGSARDINRSVDRRMSSREIRAPPKKPEPAISNASNAKKNQASAFKTNSNHAKPPQKHVKPSQKVTNVKEHDVPIVLNARISVREFKPVLQTNKPAKPLESKLSKLQKSSVQVEQNQNVIDIIEQEVQSIEEEDSVPKFSSPPEMLLDHQKSAEVLPIIPDSQPEELHLHQGDTIIENVQPVSEIPPNFTQEFIKMVDFNSDECSSEKNIGGHTGGEIVNTNPSQIPNPKSYEELRARFKQKKIQNEYGESEYDKKDFGSQNNIDSKSSLPLVQKPATSERLMPISKTVSHNERPIHTKQQTPIEVNNSTSQNRLEIPALIHQNIRSETNSKNNAKVMSSKINPKIPISNEGSFRKKLQNLRKSLNEPNFQKGKSPKPNEESRSSFTHFDSRNSKGTKEETNMHSSVITQPEFISQNTFNIVLNINQKSESQTVNIQSQVIAKPSESKSQAGGSVLRPPTSFGSKSRSFVGKGR